MIRITITYRDYQKLDFSLPRSEADALMDSILREKDFHSTGFYRDEETGDIRWTIIQIFGVRSAEWADSPAEE